VDHSTRAPPALGCGRMVKSCLQCGSTEVEEMSAALTFGRENAVPVCSLEAKLAVCFRCGFAEYFIPQELLAELKPPSS